MPENDAAILDALRDVYDPCCAERGISVVDMGLIRTAVVTGDAARVELLLTTGWCPFAARVVEDVRHRLDALPGISRVDVEVAWDEAWTTDRLSEDARRTLQFLPLPAAVADRDAFVAGRLRQTPGTPSEEE